MKKTIANNPLSPTEKTRLTGFGDGFFAIGRLVERPRPVQPYKAGGLHRDFQNVGTLLSRSMSGEIYKR